MKKFLVLILLSVSLSSFLYASSCDSYKHDKAESFAEHAGQEMVNQIGGGQNIVVDLEECEYNSYSNQFRLKIDLKFDGAIFSSDHYEVDGILKTNSDGSGASFSQTWANQQFKNLKFWTNVARAGIIVLNNLSQQNSN